MEILHLNELGASPFQVEDQHVMLEWGLLVQ